MIEIIGFINLKTKEIGAVKPSCWLVENTMTIPLCLSWLASTAWRSCLAVVNQSWELCQSSHFGSYTAADYLQSPTSARWAWPCLHHSDVIIQRKQYCSVYFGLQSVDVQYPEVEYSAGIHRHIEPILEGIYAMRLKSTCWFSCLLTGSIDSITIPAESADRLHVIFLGWWTRTRFARLRFLHLAPRLPWSCWMCFSRSSLLTVCVDWSPMCIRLQCFYVQCSLEEPHLRWPAEPLGYSLLSTVTNYIRLAASILPLLHHPHWDLGCCLQTVLSSVYVSV